MEDCRTNFRIKSVLLFCLISIIQVSCDSSQKDKQVERDYQPEQPSSDNKIVTDEAKQAEQPVPILQEKKAIAPGNIVVLALSSYDERAVVKTAQGELQALKIGDVVRGTDATLIEILDDRLVFEDIVTKPSGLKVKETVWVYKAKGGVSKVLALSRNSPDFKGLTVTKNVILSEGLTATKAVILSEN